MDTIYKPDRALFSNLCDTQPKYRALAALIEHAIDNKMLGFEQKLPAQRLLADSLSVTHGTVTRAYALLEQRGLVTAKLGAGTFVSKVIELSHFEGDTDFASSMQPMMGQQHVMTNALQSLSKDQSALKDVMIYKLNGLTSHQHFFKQWLADKGIDCLNHPLIFTQGAQQGIFTTLATLCKSGDTVIAESMCYPGFYHACHSLKLSLAQVNVYSKGIDLAQIEALCKSRTIKAVYITPNCQNPTNICYSSDNLDALLALSRRYNFFIIEDDVNYCLPEHWRLPLWQQAPDRVFYISSFSKYFAGGLRAGYLLPPRLWEQPILKQLHSECWAVSSMNFELIMRAIKSNEFAYNQTKLADEIRYRIEETKKRLKAYEIDAHFASLNVYIPLAQTQNMFEFCGVLKAHKVIVRTLDAFVLDDPTSKAGGQNGVRLTLGGPATRAEFDLGITRVEAALKQFNQTFEVVI
ncbi:PLP-dependent aminotransferase family protein [Pseudoalteromonas sp. NEC-BIFX-2020_015]|nr:PLP-dependent aminotransferase family protein [Pseudoalteromonas sp. NEC-BIFX-2020_015]